MLTLKVDYTNGNDLLRECKNFNIEFDGKRKIESYTLIRGKENIVNKLREYMKDVYTSKIKHSFREKPIELEKSEVEFLKAVFSAIDFKQKPFLIPLMTQFLTNYDKFYDNNQIQTN